MSQLAEEALIESEAVLSLQATPAEGEDVARADGFALSTFSIVLCAEIDNA